MKILIAAHDAGGAEILSSLCRKYSGDFEWVVLAAGPAEKSFRSRKVFFKSLGSWDLPSAMKEVNEINPELVLTGTGWGTDLERNFIEAAKRSGIHSAAFLDGWFNFRERFGTLTDWRKHLPGHVLVGDEDAYRLGRRNGFPKSVLTRVENPFWDFMAAKAKSISSKEGISRFLYVMQPGQKTYQKWMRRLKNRKNDIFLYPNLFFRSLGKHKNKVTVRLRPHPSEQTDKISQYMTSMKKNGYRVEKSVQGSSILDDLHSSDGVVGLESMALIMGLALGKKAISFLPKKNLICRLPQPGILKIRNAQSLQRAISRPVSRESKYRFLRNQKKFNRRFSFLKQVKGLVYE